MPNHVTNILVVNGTETQIEAVLEVLLDNDGHVDFNGVLPIPKELQGTKSPVTIISPEEYKEQEEKIARGESVFNRGVTRKISQELIKEFGYDNWYDWQINNWGTKWNAYDQKQLGKNVYQFDTAWSTPSNFIDGISKLFPEVTFEVKYADEDMGYNVGEYHVKGGEYVFIDQPEGGSVEAYNLAIDLQGGADCWIVNDLLEDDLTENELEDAIKEVKKGKYETFESIAVALAYRYKKANEGYPTILKEFLFEKAVLDEDYEYADLIQYSINNESENLNQNNYLVEFETEVLQNATIEKLETFKANLFQLLRIQKSILEIHIEAENDGYDNFENIFNTQEMIKDIESNLTILKEVMISKQSSN